MIERISKEEADIRIAAQITPRNDQYGEQGEVLMIGNGRFYFANKQTSHGQMQDFINEWQSNRIGELPSYPLICRCLCHGPMVPGPCSGCVNINCKTPNKGRKEK